MVSNSKWQEDSDWHIWPKWLHFICYWKG